jgi:hypothetical protein
MNERVKEWIRTVNETDRGLTPVLRGIIAIQKDREAGQLTIIWSSNFHCGKGRESTDRIRRHLGPFGEWKIEHVSIPEMQAADPMLDEALELGGKVVDYTEE